MEIKETEIEGVYILKPDIYGDSRGYFFESYNKERFNSLIPGAPDFVQDNQSKSCYGVVRGLHFQTPPHAQAKLVRVVIGTVLDVAVDLRPDSKTFGKYVSVELSAENRLQFYMPEGFAHGFSVLSEEAMFQYKCSSLFNHESEGGIQWNDPDINIDWKLNPKDVILSAKDISRQSLKEYARANRINF